MLAFFPCCCGAFNTLINPWQNIYADNIGLANVLDFCKRFLQTILQLLSETLWQPCPGLLEAVIPGSCQHDLFPVLFHLCFFLFCGSGFGQWSICAKKRVPAPRLFSSFNLRLLFPQACTHTRPWSGQTLQFHYKHILWKPPSCECIRHQRCQHLKGVDFYSDDELNICPDHAELPELLSAQNKPD